VADASKAAFTDSGLVIIDTQTNLMWEKKTTAVGSGENLGDLHDVDNLYTWCQATGNKEGPRCLNNPSSWIGEVNAAAFAGFSDWRVPTSEELLTIVDRNVMTCDRGPACIDPLFGATEPFDYWSSKEVSPNVAWIGNFPRGILRFGTKSDGAHVRAVRNSAPK